MEEVLPGVRSWKATHPGIDSEVHSEWVPAAGAVIDPLLAEPGDIDAFREQPPDRVLLSNRHHLRSSERFVEEFGCTIHCHSSGLHEFEDGPDVQGFEWGDEVAPGIVALEVGAITPEDAGLLIRDAKALVVADALVNFEEVRTVSDDLLGDDPERIRADIKASFRRILDEGHDFDSLLFAHGEPLLGGAKEALREFCS